MDSNELSSTNVQKGKERERESFWPMIGEVGKRLKKAFCRWTNFYDQSQLKNYSFLSTQPPSYISSRSPMLQEPNLLPSIEHVTAQSIPTSGTNVFRYSLACPSGTHISGCFCHGFHLRREMLCCFYIQPRMGRDQMLFTQLVIFTVTVDFYLLRLFFILVQNNSIC